MVLDENPQVIKRSGYKNVATKNILVLLWSDFLFAIRTFTLRSRQADTSVLMETADLISVFKKLSISVNQRGTWQLRTRTDVRSKKLKKITVQEKMEGN